MGTAFRILDPFPAYTNNQNVPVSGGTLRFYDTGTTTPRTIYGDKAKTVNLGSSVTLDTSGRTNSDVWGDGVYRVRLYDSLGVLIDEADNVDIPGGTAQTFPTFVAGGYLTNDGAVMSWTAIRQVPDPTGSAGKQLGNDGTNLLWETKADPNRTLQQTVTAAATTNIDYSLGPVVLLNQAVDITALTFSNLPVAGYAGVLTIFRKKDATATARAITWPASFKWPGAAPPTLTQTSAAVDIISVMTFDGGATFYPTSSADAR